MNNSDNFHGYPAFKDIFISVREYNARIKDLSVQSFSTFIIYLFRYRTGMETVTQHLNNIMCIKLHLSLNALRKSPISWFVQSICCIYISCIFSSLDVTRSPWDLISSKAWLNLRLHLQPRSLCVSFCPGLSFFLSSFPSLILAGWQFPLNGALFPCWTQQKGLRGCRYLLKIWPMKYPLFLSRVLGLRHCGNPERHQFHHRNLPPF